MPDQIEISDDDTGLGSETWIATCGGNRYVCSQVVTGASTGPKTSAYTSQVNCAPEGGEARQAEAPPPPKTEDTAGTNAAPPRGAGGFLFGQSHDDMAQACSGGGFEFADAGPHQARCSGLPTDIGFKASAELLLCGNALCRIAIVADPSVTGALQVKSFIGIAEALARKYGQPFERESTLPTECRNESATQGCLDTGKIVLKQHWRWTAYDISLSLAKPDNAEKSVLRINYAQTSAIARLKTDAL